MFIQPGTRLGSYVASSGGFRTAQFARLFLLPGLFGGAVVLALQEPADIPRTWASEDISAFALPLASDEHSPEHVSEDYYYQLPERSVFKSYPIYHPDHEPAGYRGWLGRQTPEVVFAEADLDSEQAWLAAGALVFSAPIGYSGPISNEHVGDRAWYEEVGVPTTADGVMPYARWVIRTAGRPEVGNLSCAMCHIRVMPDGTAVSGAQGNFPFDRSIARDLGATPVESIRAGLRQLTFAPWAADDPVMGLRKDDLLATLASIPAGVIMRHGTNVAYPARVPDLIGVQERHYLDATGLLRHRAIGDLMRYSASNQGVDMLARYGDYIPAGIGERGRPAPGAGRTVGTADRYSDAQLFALARYIYSLEPPPNPHPRDGQAQAGEAVFEREGCGRCHSPPLYTNNHLIPVGGFSPPREHLELYAILDVPLGTDPGLALRTRRGTGYYKVPSLKGVWYRGPFEHSGSVATLEDWFDPARLGDNYRPTGFAGLAGKPRAVPGHNFGLSLSENDKDALIVFLKTL